MAKLRKKSRVRPVKCEICGTVFETSHSQGKYCNDDCKRQGERASWRKYGRKNKQRRHNYHKDYYNKNKEQMIARIEAYNATEAGRQAQRKSDITKRALKCRNHEPYAETYIYERDNWMCQLCGRKINIRLKWPNPLSKSIDHIVPLSKGGADAPVNVQAVHLRCNMSKHNKLRGQLRLIG